MKFRNVVAGSAVALAGMVGLAPMAGADPVGQGPNWGSEVKACNASSCYPGGTNRGTYVREQAKDGDGPGYGREIHDLAHPGASDPGGLGNGGTGGPGGGGGGGA